VSGGRQLGDDAGQGLGGLVELGGADLPAQFIRRGEEFVGCPSLQVGVVAEVVQVERLADGADEAVEAILLGARSHRAVLSGR
jgi:hypothetical protein